MLPQLDLRTERNTPIQIYSIYNIYSIIPVNEKQQILRQTRNKKVSRAFYLLSPCNSYSIITRKVRNKNEKSRETFCLKTQNIYSRRQQGRSETNSIISTNPESALF